MEKTMVLQLLLCVASAVAGVLVGLMLTKRTREIAWNKGYGAGIGVVASAIRRGMPRALDERMGWVYRVPVAGLNRVVEYANEPETVERERKKTEN